MVVATGAFHHPRIPGFAELDPGIRQLHSSGYRRPAQLREGGVLVVGAANSGAEIALELAAAGHPTWLSGPHPGNEPFRAGGRADRLTTPLLWFALSSVLSVDNPVGRRLRPKLPRRPPRWPGCGGDLDAAGIQRMPRTAGVRDGLPLLEDGRALEVANVVWCTGFRHDFSWIDLPVLGPGDAPRHDHGVVASSPASTSSGCTSSPRSSPRWSAGSATTPSTSRPGSPSQACWQRAHERRARCTRSNRCCWR